MQWFEQQTWWIIARFGLNSMPSIFATNWRYLRCNFHTFIKTNQNHIWTSANYYVWLNFYVVSSCYVCVCTLLLILRNHCFSLREALVNTIFMQKISPWHNYDCERFPEGFVYATLCSCQKNNIYETRMQEVCSTWNLRNLTQHHAFLSPQIDMT